MNQIYSAKIAYVISHLLKFSVPKYTSKNQPRACKLPTIEVCGHVQLQNVLVLAPGLLFNPQESNFIFSDMHMQSEPARFGLVHTQDGYEYQGNESESVF